MNTASTLAHDAVARLLDLLAIPEGPLPPVPFFPDGAPDGSFDEAGSNEQEFGDDPFDSGDAPDGGEDQPRGGHCPVDSGEVCGFGPAEAVTLAAVDANMTRLGGTGQGLVVALRATCTVDWVTGGSTADVLRTGPLHLRLEDRGRLLHRMGMDQGAPEFFVRLTGDPEHPVPEAKPGAANHGAILADRLRNHIERITQVHGLGLLPTGAVLLLDSSLTQRSRDTSPEWWAAFAAAAAAGGVSLVAVSKRSVLTVQDRPIAFWLDDQRQRSCYRRLTALLHAENPARAARNLGGLYAVRFSANGPTLRVDVLAAGGRTDSEVLNAVTASCTIRGGMPEPLVRAHALAYITQPAYRVLQADAVVRFGLDPRRDENLGPGVYGFSAGRFK